MKKDRVQDKFLEELKKVPIVRVACKNSGILHNSIYRWRNEDPDFALLMEEALSEGEDHINDLSESQLISLIKDEKYPAIRFWLTHRHPKYKKQEVMAVRTVDNRLDEDVIIKELGLTREDFKEENRIKTAKRIADYLANL
jgi:hypothetical protein